MIYICTISDKRGFVGRCIGTLEECQAYGDAAREVGWKVKLEGPFRKERKSNG